MMHIRSFITVLGVGLLTACSFKPVVLPDVHNYNLSPAYDEAVFSEQVSSHNTLLITSPTANSVYQTQDILYMPQPYEYKHFAVNRWVAEPTQMWGSFLSVAFERLHYFSLVSSGSLSAMPDYRLDTHILAFQKEYTDSGPVVRVIVRATLTGADQHKLLAQKIFQTQVAAPGGIYNTVLAFNKATTVNAERIAQFAVSFAKINTQNSRMKKGTRMEHYASVLHRK